MEHGLTGSISTAIVDFDVAEMLEGGPSAFPLITRLTTVPGRTGLA